MTHHVFTRQALYDLVWAEPMRTLAKRYGVSDVGLAKACRRGDIPVPERGHWTKRQHGKPTPQPALPQRPDLPDQVVLAPAAPRAPPSPVAQAVLDSTDPPEVLVPDVLRKPHPLVRAWLEENDRRRREAKRHDWGVIPPDLSAPLTRRRLRLYHALYTALGDIGFKLTAQTHPDGWSEAQKGGETITFRIYERQRQVRRPITEDEKRWSWNAGKTTLPDLIAADDLVLKIKTYSHGAMPEDFREKTVVLEQQLGAVVVDFEAGIAELKAWRIEQAAAEERYRQAQAALQRRRQRQAQEEAQTAALLQAAARWRQAQDLRAYIAAAGRSPAASEAGFGAWRAWALGQAEALDPLSGNGPDLALLPPFAG